MSRIAKINKGHGRNDGLRRRIQEAQKKKWERELLGAIARNLSPEETLISPIRQSTAPRNRPLTPAEEIRQRREQQRQFRRKAEKSAQIALMTERIGDMKTSEKYWKESMSWDGKAKALEKEVLQQESISGSHARRPSLEKRQKTASREPIQRPPEETGIGYDSAMASAQEKYDAYAAAEKNLENNYLWRKDPEADAGYAPASAEREQAQEAYLAEIDAIMDNLENILPENTTATPVTAAEWEDVLLRRDQLIRELWAYYDGSGGNPELDVVAMYAEEIAGLNAILAAPPTEAQNEEVLLQMLGGNYYTGESTLAGVGGQMALGTLGLDYGADMRDLTYDLTHLESVTPGQIVLDAIGFLPLVGGMKYADELADIAKHGDELAGAAADAVKHGDEVTGAAADTGRKADELLRAIEENLATGKYTDELLENGGAGVYNGVKVSNQEVREWYVTRVSAIGDSIDSSLPLEERARLAFDARNNLRTTARDMMEDMDTRAMLDLSRPNWTFDDLLKNKMMRKGMSKEEALLDIYRTATKTNKEVNQSFGIGG